jgi:lipopolysaccharide export LptBFGC system permease protein LptF
MGIIIVVLSMMLILFVAPVVLKKRRRKMEGYKRVKSARREVAPEYEQRVVA